MRSSPALILGAPVASWATFGCLGLEGVHTETAGIVAVVWGLFWLVVGLLAPSRRRAGRQGRSELRYRSGRARAYFRVAVASTMLVPVPVYLLALGANALGFAAPNVTLPMFAILGAPAPLVFWWMALRPSDAEFDRAINPIGFHRYETPLVQQPPRNSFVRRAV